MNFKKEKLAKSIKENLNKKILKRTKNKKNT